MASHNLASPSSSSSSSASNEPIPTVSLQDGPLSYRYTLSHLTFHYGRQLNYGSEHLIDGNQFPGEVQLYFYNSQLYQSFEDGATKSNGVAAIAILIQVSTDSKLSNPQLKRITHALKNITSKGSSQYINALNMNDLMNITTGGAISRNYMTYEGSLTEPGCYETVTWIILNKPIYMTSHLFHSLIHSMSSESSHHSADNFRPVQKINSRSIRTNIDFASGSSFSNNDNDNNEKASSNHGYDNDDEDSDEEVRIII